MIDVVPQNIEAERRVLGALALSVTRRLRRRWITHEAWA